MLAESIYGPNSSAGTVALHCRAALGLDGSETRPHMVFAEGLFPRRHVGSCNPIMPAELIFVEQAPGVSQSQRYAGKH